MRTTPVALVVVVALGSAVAPAAAAGPPLKLLVESSDGLPDAGQPTLWTGTMLRDGPRIPDVPECAAVSCQRIKVQVKLPAKLWRQRPGGLQIAIRFITGTPDDNLALVVYRDGARIAASTAQVGTAQSVIIRSANNGIYDVYVVDGIAFGDPAPTPAIPYEGLTQVVYDPPAQPHRDLLPDLVALPQQNVTFGPPFPIFDDPVPDSAPTCHQSEVDEDGAHLCLRFDQVLGNTGAGALDLRFNRAVGSVPTNHETTPVAQRIYASDGSSHDVAAGVVEWHAIHQHYHLEGFAQSNLWAIDAAGQRTGAVPVAVGNKVSFCIATTNINPAYWSHRAFAADEYPAPDCLQPYATSGGFDHFKQGMSVGWTDEYNWFLPGQYVEVTGVGDGDYILDTTVDPTGRLIESDKTNNCGSIYVRLTNMSSPIPQVEILGPGPACN